MANERTYPCLPTGELDGSIAFYESLGFQKTYRQVRPNPYAVVARDDIQIHLFGIEGFDPAESYGSGTAEEVRHGAWVQCRGPGRELAADLQAR